MENIFYYYGIIYILHRIFIIGRGIYFRNYVLEEVTEPSPLGPVSMIDIVTKEVSKFEMTLWFTNTIWVIMGLLMPESHWFLFSLLIGCVHIYFSHFTETTHKAFYLTHVIKILVVTYIIYPHLF